MRLWLLEQAMIGRYDRSWRSYQENAEPYWRSALGFLLSILLGLTLGAVVFCLLNLA